MTNQEAGDVAPHARPRTLRESRLRSPLSPAWERARVRGIAVNRKNAGCIPLRMCYLSPRSYSGRDCDTHSAKHPNCDVGGTRQPDPTTSLLDSSPPDTPEAYSPLAKADTGHTFAGKTNSGGGVYFSYHSHIPAGAGTPRYDNGIGRGMRFGAHLPRPSPPLWIPACAGMTTRQVIFVPITHAGCRRHTKGLKIRQLVARHKPVPCPSPSGFQLSLERRVREQE